MRFILIDKVVSLETGKQIKTVKNVSLAEEYLSDHMAQYQKQMSQARQVVLYKQNEEL